MHIPSGSEAWSMLKQTFTDWSEDKAPKLAAALALYTMLSIGPLLVIVLKVIGVAFGEEAANGKMGQALGGVVPGGAAEFAQQAAQNAGQHGEGILATVVSSLLLVFTATGVFAELQDSMNTIWEVKPKPRSGIWDFIRQRFLSFAMVLGLAFLFMVSTVGTTLITTISEGLFGDNKVIAMITSHAASLVVMTALFAAIFKLLPDVNIAWRDVVIGAVLTGVLFEIGKVLLSWYIGKQTEGDAGIYGKAGSLAALLLYIYYSAQILFFGAEFTQVYARRFGTGIQPSENAERETSANRPPRGEEQGAMGARPAPKPAAAAAAAGARPPMRPLPRPIVQPVPVAMATTQQRQRQYLFGSSGLALGLIAGGLAIFGLTTRKRVNAKTQVAVQLDDRLDNLEQRILRVNKAFDIVKNTSMPKNDRTLKQRIRDYVWRHPTLWPMAKGLRMHQMKV